MGFPPFGGLTIFVSPWLPTVLDPVAIFATISALPFGATGPSIIGLFLLLGSFKCCAP